MSNLARIIKSATPSTGVLFRKGPYGREDVRTFLRDVMALANAAVDGPRYIVVGVEFDAKGRKCVHPVDDDDFSGKPDYPALVTEHIEPQLKLSYRPISVDGRRLGVFEIVEGQDKPYMMRIDHCDTLRRGDAYMRVNDAPIKMGRRQLKGLFEEQFHDSISAACVEVGFPGEIIYKDLRIPTRELDNLPSAIATARLTELVDSRSKVQFANTTVRRLTHARLFGPDSPYEDRTEEEIHTEMRQIERRYRDHDAAFLFEDHKTELQLVVYNQGDEPLRDASIRLVLPRHPALHVAESLPKTYRDECFVERTPAQLAGYPKVTQLDEAVHVAAKLGDIEPGEPVDVFTKPLRICVGDALAGRRIGIQYSFLARNLRSTAQGKLRLLF